MSKNIGNKVAPMGRHFIAYGASHRIRTNGDVMKPCKGDIILNAYLYDEISPLQGLYSCDIL